MRKKRGSLEAKILNGIRTERMQTQTGAGTEKKLQQRDAMANRFGRGAKTKPTNPRIECRFQATPRRIQVSHGVMQEAPWKRRLTRRSELLMCVRRYSEADNVHESS
jgi:hypothetical protein